MKKVMIASSKYRTLRSLLKGVDHQIVSYLSDELMDGQQIASVTVDSRQAGTESLFVALPGAVNDGHSFISSAVVSGCKAILCLPGRVSLQQAEELVVTVIEVENTATAYAKIAENYFGRPAEKLRCVAITGTNGKTTSTYLLEQVLLEAGQTVGVIGTVNNRYTNSKGEKKTLKTNFTTPEAFLLQQLLREMVDSGVENVIMEVSSHGLAQSRIGSLQFDVAAFTNLSRDHLDYHLDMEEYFQAKRLLFSEHIKSNGIAVLPVVAKEQSPTKAMLLQLHETCQKSCKTTIKWGESESADIRLESYGTALDETTITIRTFSGRHFLSSPLVGRYNIDNLLTVYGMSVALKIEDSIICKALSSATGAPGRVERVKTGSAWDSKGPVVLVDYAHTPDALKKVLETVAALPRNKLFCVFGCGGDRDRGKRPLMGEIAGQLCDVVVVTDDNPRTENPDAIVSQILGGLNLSKLTQLSPSKDRRLAAGSGEDHGYVVIRDRAQAIETAIRSASPEDIVVIAGKGHEPYQLTLQGKRFFDDRQEAKRVLFSWTAELVARAAAGTPHSENRSGKLLGPVVTDSRTFCRDGIFIALKGENHDAHDFVHQAVENGASCLLVEKKVDLQPEMEVSQIKVQDTQYALGELAAFRRRALAAQSQQYIVGITGSCGKTTVKEMVAAILSRRWPEGSDFPADCVLKTKGNFNNLIGMPLSLLPLDVHHRAAVLEMGMNQPGELRRLGAIADPDISCITNIHGAHLEGLQSIEGVAKAKEELFAATKKSGLLVVNLDDKWVSALSRKYPHQKLRFSAKYQKKQQTGAGVPGENPDVWASDIKQTEGRFYTFSLHYHSQEVEIELYIAGEHNISNALCAAAIALATGANLAQVARGLADFRPPDKRMQLLTAKSGFTIVNDTYNANPASMAAGLRTLKELGGDSTVAIIGDMLELGDTSRQAHFNIGRLIAELAISSVGVVGDFKQDVVQGALEHGFAQDCLQLFKDKKHAANWIKELLAEKKLGKDGVVLVKASRGLAFETIVAELLEI